MPLVRGRILPEIESAGRVKKFLDILLCVGELRGPQMRALDELMILRAYLNSLRPLVCQIRLWVPRDNSNVTKLLSAYGIQHEIVRSVTASLEVQRALKGAPPELGNAVSTALSIDADCVVTDNTEWFPFIEDVEKLSMLLTDCGFLLPYSEVFVRGHDVPWAFQEKVWNITWTTFYLHSERSTFKLGFQLLHKAFQNSAPADALETGRSLVYNRLPSLCFTRDRLLFYEIQRLAARRAGWKRQRFGFEIAYHLNFNYLLLYGTFDHAALFVSQLFSFGLGPREAGATYSNFLKILREKSPRLHAAFTEEPNKSFIDRIGALRHFAAHRGSLQPTKVFERLEREPTVEELDADIRAEGLEDTINMLPEGAGREGFREMVRSNMRFARYEKATLLEGVVPIELDGKQGLIWPHLDTCWNFSRVVSFLSDIFSECSNLL